MLGNWWNRNTHGRRLWGNVVGVVGLVLIVVLVAANPGLVISPNPAGMLGVLTGGALATLVEYRQKRDPMVVLRVLGRVVILLVFIWAITDVSPSIAPTLIEIPLIRDLSPVLFALSVGLLALSGYLWEDDPRMRRWAVVATGGLGVIVVGGVVGTGGGPWAPLGVAMLLLASAVILGLLVYRHFLQEPTTTTRPS
jgi:hypothetical protein